MLRTLVLLAAYYVVVTPAGLAWRLGRDPLRRRWDSKAPSYLTYARPGGGSHVRSRRPQ